MQVHETEKSLEDIQSYVNEVFEFIVSNAGTYEANEMEEAIKKKIFRLGKEFLKSYFLEKGTGDKGAELDTVNGIYERDRRLHKKNYYSIFGKIEVNRTCYKKNGTDNIYPLDMEANLPERSYSYVLQEFMNLESSKHPFKDSSETIGKFLDLDLSVNALEIVSKDSVCDYETFYEKYEVKEVSSAIVVISYDGKGIPMTSKESEKIKGHENKDESNKVRLGKGKKKQKKKEALAGVCYETEEKFRSAEEVAKNLVFGNTEKKKDKSPRAQNIRRMASIEKSKRKVVEEIKKEAERRDSNHNSIWSIVMDGAPYLWRLVSLIFKGINFIPILDIIHVIEYLWDAGNALFGDKSSERHLWVYEKLVKILQGKVSKVIKELKYEAKKKNIKSGNLKQVKRSVKYFENHKKWMKYDQYLEKGLPIASGVVESTCGHLIKDRMELSGCKWNIQGAETILKLRSIKTSDNWNEYWTYHIAQQKKLLYDCKQVA